MEVRAETKKIFKDYGKNLVNAGLISHGELKEALSRLSKTPKFADETTSKKLISKREAASLLGYKNTRSIDRLEKKGYLERINNEIIGQVRYLYSDIMKLMSLVS